MAAVGPHFSAAIDTGPTEVGPYCGLPEVEPTFRPD